MIDGEHYHLGPIADTIIFDRQVKYIKQGGDVKECPYFDTSAFYQQSCVPLAKGDSVLSVVGLYDEKFLFMLLQAWR